MNGMLFQILDQSICIRLTQTLLHFVWQGTAIGLFAVFMAWMCRTAGSRVLYVIHAASLVLMALCVPITFLLTDASGIKVIEHEVVVLSESGSDAPIFEAVPPASFEEGVSELEISVNQERSPTFRDALDSTVLPMRKSEHSSWDISHVVMGSHFESVILKYAPYAASAYLLGVLVMLGRLCRALWGGHLLRRSAKPVSDRKLLNRIRSQAKRIRLSAVPVVAYCERIAIPVVAGIVRPMILLPVWIATAMDPEQVMVIVAVHCAKRDDDRNRGNFVDYPDGTESIARPDERRTDRTDPGDAGADRGVDAL